MEIKLFIFLLLDAKNAVGQMTFFLSNSWHWMTDQTTCVFVCVFTYMLFLFFPKFYLWSSQLNFQSCLVAAGRWRRCVFQWHHYQKLLRPPSLIGGHLESPACRFSFHILHLHALLLLLRVLQTVFRVAAQLELQGMFLSWFTCGKSVDLHEILVYKGKTTSCFKPPINVPIHARWII